MKTSATNRRLRQLLTGIRDKTLIPNPHFQRRLVWSNIHKIAFLETVLEGLPFPEIFTAAGAVDPDTGDGAELIVDGQQRITTLHQYFTAHKDLALPPGMLPYAKLEDVQKIEFLEYEVVVRDLGSLTEQQTQDIFHRINSTKYSLNAMEVNHSRYDGELKQFAERIISNEFFQHEDHPVFNSLDGRRMNDTRFALTLIITMMSGYFNRDDEHELYLQKYNDHFAEATDIEPRIDRVLAVLQDADFPDDSRLWQKAHLLTAMVELDRFFENYGGDIKGEDLRTRAEQFYADVEAVTRGEAADPMVAQYYRRVRSASNDRISRWERGQAFRSGVLGVAPD